MTHLRQYLSEGGTYFENNVAAVPVCGPSRSSLLQGRYPHNTHYWCNDDLDSVAAWKDEGNETVGTWLSRAGYHTAFVSV